MSPRTGRLKSKNPKVKQLGVRFDKEALDKLDVVENHYQETRVESLRGCVEKLYLEIMVLVYK